MKKKIVKIRCRILAKDIKKTIKIVDKLLDMNEDENNSDIPYSSELGENLIKISSIAKVVYKELINIEKDY